MVCANCGSYERDKARCPVASCPRKYCVRSSGCDNIAISGVENSVKSIAPCYRGCAAHWLTDYVLHSSNSLEFGLGCKLTTGLKKGPCAVCHLKGNDHYAATSVSLANGETLSPKVTLVICKGCLEKTIGTSVTGSSLTYHSGMAENDADSSFSSTDTASSSAASVPWPLSPSSPAASSSPSRPRLDKSKLLGSMKSVMAKAAPKVEEIAKKAAAKYESSRQQSGSVGGSGTSGGAEGRPVQLVENDTMHARDGADGFSSWQEVIRPTGKSNGPEMKPGDTNDAAVKNVPREKGIYEFALKAPDGTITVIYCGRAQGGNVTLQSRLKEYMATGSHGHMATNELDSFFEKGFTLLHRSKILDDPVQGELDMFKKYDYSFNTQDQKGGLKKAERAKRREEMTVAKNGKKRDDHPNLKDDGTRDMRYAHNKGLEEGLGMDFRTTAGKAFLKEKKFSSAEQYRAYMKQHLNASSAGPDAKSTQSVSSSQTASSQADIPSDFRTKEGRQYMADNGFASAAEARAAHKALHVSPPAPAPASVQSSPSYDYNASSSSGYSGSSYGNYSSSYGYSGSSSSYSTSGGGGYGGGGGGGGPRCKDGSLDMRYACNKGLNKYG